jgi:hypothetical protein
MKEGRSLPDLAAEIERQHKTKRDFIGPTSKMRMMLDSSIDDIAVDSTRMELEGLGQFGINDNGHSQLAARLLIPKTYYDRCRRIAPGLLAGNVNHWLAEGTEKRLVRTLDDKVRAYLSDSYRILDNYDFAENVLPIFQKSGLKVRSCEVTETHLYLKAVLESQQADIKVGDTVRGGVMLRNSETGNGALFATGFIEVLVCTNGMVVNEPFRKAHLGRKQHGGIVDVAEYYRNDTREADDKALWLKVRDTVEHIISEEYFTATVEKLRDATKEKIEGDPAKAIEEVTKKLSLSENESGSVLRHLIEGGDLSRWGIANAVTRTAEDAERYERATELEAAGYKIIEMPKREWEKVALAA